MKYKQILNCLLTITLLLGALTNVQAQEQDEPELNAPGENVILQWNRVLQETIRTPEQQLPTIFPVRSFAMMHAAMFDAVNSIDGAYTPYLIEVPGSRRASQEAAAAQAAHDVLAALYPTRQDIFAAELTNSLNGIPPNRAKQGIRVGEIVAEKMLAARADDGWSVMPPPYVLPQTPGNWQPTPPAMALAGFTHYPAVLPFAITSSARFTPNPPPTLTSAEYTAAFNEVKEIGSATSTTRTADQTQVARLWANVNTPTTVFFVWNNVARSVAVSRNNTTAENARLFALMNISFHDALQTTFASKFVYGLWRPVTAIRRADEDGNPHTEPDGNWSSLIGNPPYPTYAGNHAAIGTSQSTILALFFGRDDIRFEHTWEGAGGATRSYPGFTAMANEEERSRVYGGIHFTFDQTAGQSAGRNVANYVFLNFMRPRR
ncbi:MAG: vanadium-dependent haloperoxidase [Pyrinomonadaceae bacterium]|nr:vanadium-dependent haloperoxidase [Pyrinomonadaceae bacterium]